MVPEIPPGNRERERASERERERESNTNATVRRCDRVWKRRRVRQESHKLGYTVVFVSRKRSNYMRAFQRACLVFSPVWKRNYYCGSDLCACNQGKPSQNNLLEKMEHFPKEKLTFTFEKNKANQFSREKAKVASQ